MIKYWKCYGKQPICEKPCYIENHTKPIPNMCYFDDTVKIEEITKEEFLKEVGE